MLRVSWTNLLLLSWPLPPRDVRPAIPQDLELDTLHGQAWVSIVVSRIAGAHPPWMFPLPWLSNFLALGVRICVRKQAERGVFFLSIDTERAWAASFGRSWLHLPCFRARIQMTRDRTASLVASVRRHQGAASAALTCEWRPAATMPQTGPYDLRHFLDARHQVFTSHEGRLLSGDLWHSPFCWRDVEIRRLDSSMLEAAGLPSPETTPVAHEAEARAIEIWPMRLVNADASDSALLDTVLAPPPAG
ncbi:MAG: DUF2071 domain-containing protein [Opitutaceae bacterium]